MLACLGVMSFAAPAWAGNGIFPGPLSLTTHYHTARLRLPYMGDDNRNATVLVRYSRGRTFNASSADTAVVPFRDAALRRFTCVILWLDPNTDYSVRVDVSDPDGGGAQLLPAYVTTRANPPHTIPSNRVFVSPAGDDDNPGTLAAPKRTIMGGVMALTPGGQVRVLPGVYHETVWLQQEGTPTSYYSIVGHGNPDSVIIDGSDPALLNAPWTRYTTPAGASVGSMFYRIDHGASSVHNIVAGWGQRLHTRVSVAELRDYTQYPSLPYAGWARNKDTLFVRLEMGLNPNNTTMHVAKLMHGIRITGQYWRAESLTVRFTGDKGYFLGMWSGADSSATGAVIRNCRGYSIGLQGIYGNLNTHDVLVDSCRFEDGRIDRWSYAASKARYEENATGLTAVGRDWVVRNSVFMGHANGVQVIGMPGDSLEKNSGSDSDIYGNRIERMADDGIENDNNQGVNQAIWGNFVSRCNFGFSPNPMFTGPVYVLYNEFDSNDAGDVKFGGNSTAATYYVHNTMTSSSCHSAMCNVGETFKNVMFRNNVFASPGDPACWNLPFWDQHGGLDTTVTLFGPIFDYNLWSAANKNGEYLVWKGLRRKWKYLRESLGWEAHGVASTPTFVDSAKDDFRPRAGAVQLDRAARILGINTRNKTGPRLYVGYPDLGAREYGLLANNQPPLDAPGGEDPDPFAPGLTGPPFSLGPAHPNPSRSATVFRLTLPSLTQVEANVYDLSGRRVVCLVKPCEMIAGTHELRWDRRRTDGGLAAPGVYFVRVMSPLGSGVQRVVLLD